MIGLHCKKKRIGFLVVLTADLYCFFSWKELQIKRKCTAEKRDGNEHIGAKQSFERFANFT